MSKYHFNMNEFIDQEEYEDEFPDEVSEADEVDIQKAVVEELASEKAALTETLSEKENEIASLRDTSAALEKTIAERESELTSLRGELERLTQELSSLKEKSAALESQLDEALSKQLEPSSDNSKPNSLALLDRDVELPDRFVGETRDHVLEAVKDARDRAEAEGRVRRVQLLEGVLVCNEPVGTLAQRRDELKKLFETNGHIINSAVHDELNRLGISHKKGEEYLLPKEILLRTY